MKPSYHGKRQKFKPWHIAKHTKRIPRQTRMIMQTGRSEICKNFQILSIHSNLQQMPQKNKKISGRENL